MRYGFKRADDDETGDAFGQSNASSGFEAQSQQTPGAAPGNGAGQSYTDFLGGNGGGEATQTGFLNFDRFFNANAGVANREAKRVNEGAANQADKARKGVQGVNDAYSAQLAGLGGGANAAQPSFDKEGNWLGGAAGPQPGSAIAPPVVAPQADDAEVDEYGIPKGYGRSREASAAMPAWNTGQDYRSFLESQGAAAAAGANSVPDFTDTEGYEAAGQDIREAQRQLDALGSEEGLAELSGGNWADAALYGTAGRKAFQETRDAYGKPGTGHDSITDYANAVADDATKRGEYRGAQLRDNARSYGEALSQYDERQKPGEPSGAAAPGEAPKNWREQLDVIVAEFPVDEKVAANNAKSRGYAEDVTKWGVAEQLGQEAGLSPEQSQAQWTRFRSSLSPQMQDYIDALANWSTNTDNGARPTGGSVFDSNGGDKQLDALAAKIQALYRAWLADNGATETQTSGGLTSDITRNG